MKKYVVYLIISVVLVGGLAIISDAKKPETKPEKVVLCHNGHLIEVSVNAVEAHLAHGDTKAVWDDETQTYLPCPEPQLPDCIDATDCDCYDQETQEIRECPEE